MDIERARVDPAGVFTRPEAVRDHPALGRIEKIEILERWEFDARSLGVAEEENMSGVEGDLLHRVRVCLRSLGAAEEHADRARGRAGPGSRTGDATAN